MGRGRHRQAHHQLSSKKDEVKHLNVLVAALELLMSARWHPVCCLSTSEGDVIAGRCLSFLFAERHKSGGRGGARGKERPSRSAQESPEQLVGCHFLVLKKN